MKNECVRIGLYRRRPLVEMCLSQWNWRAKDQRCGDDEMRIWYILHKISSYYLKPNINELPFSFLFSRFCWVLPRLVPFTLRARYRMNRISLSSRRLVLFFFNIYFCHSISYHLGSSEFSSFASSFSSALDRCFWKFPHHFNCYLFLQFLITSLLWKFTGLFCISLRSDFILCLLHSAPVNDLQSPIYNNQWKKLKMKKRKLNGKCL